MQEIEIKKSDVLEQMYFLLSLIQTHEGPMRSRIGGKNDFMGGILDRYINTIVEDLVFTKILFPKLNLEKKIDIIRDYYYYDPVIASIAPDLFGVIVDNHAIPFVTYNNGWEAVENCPQVEIKTLKRNQRMLSLVNQHYDNKYLLIMESDYNTDYLMPFMDTNIFNDGLYKHMMDKVDLYNDKILISDDNEYVKSMNKINFDNDTLGKIKLLLVTKTESFIKACNIAGKGITPECIEKKEIVKNQKDTSKPLLKFCKELEKNYYRFNDNWYNLKDKNGNYYRSKNKMITLDFFCNNIKAIEFLKMNKGNFYLRVKKTEEPVILNNEVLIPGNDYRITLFSGFDRSGTNNEEYFIDKSIYQRIIPYENELLNDIKKIIDNVA